MDYNGHESIEEYLTQEEKAERYYRDVTIGDSNIPFIRFYTPEFYKHVVHSIRNNKHLQKDISLIQDMISGFIGLDIKEHSC